MQKNIYEGVSWFLSVRMVAGQCFFINLLLRQCVFLSVCLSTYMSVHVSVFPISIIFSAWLSVLAFGCSNVGLYIFINFQMNRCRIFPSNLQMTRWTSNILKIITPAQDGYIVFQFLAQLVCFMHIHTCVDHHNDPDSSSIKTQSIVCSLPCAIPRATWWSECFVHTI